MKKIAIGYFEDEGKDVYGIGIFDAQGHIEYTTEYYEADIFLSNFLHKFFTFPDRVDFKVNFKKIEKPNSGIDVKSTDLTDFDLFARKVRKIVQETQSIEVSYMDGITRIKARLTWIEAMCNEVINGTSRWRDI